MRQMRCTSYVVLALLVVAGCGDNSGPPAVPDAGVEVDADVGVDANDEPPLTRYCREVNEVICAGLETCGCRFDTRPYDAEECVEVRTAECVEATAPQASDVAAGRARVDETALARCLVALEAKAAACDDASLPVECRDAVLAAAELGETCELAGGGLAFCAAGAGVCRPDNQECTQLPGDGDECLGGVLCGRDLVCVAGSCAAPGGADDACEPGSCGAGLVCGVDGHCVAPGGVDAPCAIDAHCAEGLRCDGTCQVAPAVGDDCRGPGQCGAERSCVPAPETRTCGTPDGVGETCETNSCGDGLTCDSGALECVALPGVDEPCLDNQCADGLTCADGLGTCITLPGEGETCASGSRFCADGLGCRESTSTCEVPPGEGEPCLINPPDYLCATGFGCDFDAGSICVAQGEAGASCTSDRGCVAATYCEVSTSLCTPRLADGSACEDGNECQVGHECALVAGAFVCRALPTADQPCFLECAAELACKGPGGECAAAFCSAR
jgi:hypothetical protein